VVIDFTLYSFFFFFSFFLFLILIVQLSGWLKHEIHEDAKERGENYKTK